MSALNRQPPARPAALEARVSNPDPEALTVTIDDFDGDLLARHVWEVASWPRTTEAVPARGDRCLVVMSEIGRAWVVAGEWSGAPPTTARTWRTLPFATGWSALNSSYPSGYVKSPDGWVTLRGIVRKSTQPAPYESIFAQPLPVGFRPASLRSFAVVVETNLAARVRVAPTGEVVVCEVPAAAAAGAYWTLDSVGYWAEN